MLQNRTKGSPSGVGVANRETSATSYAEASDPSFVPSAANLDKSGLEGALAEEYTAFGGCFSDPIEGGMGYHYVNDALVTDPEIDPLRPELLVYERRPNGEMQLVAVEYITFVSAWHAAGHTEPPSLFGQEFHINPTLLAEPFYLLHVWVWKNNPSGTLSDWNPTVRCP